MNKTTSTPSSEAQPNPRVVIVDLEDKLGVWLKQITAAVQAHPAEIHVHICGKESVFGPVFCPHATITLRNAILNIPENIRVVTFALSSLPPFLCAAWLAGDERWMAKDIVMWIPDATEEILRNGMKDLDGSFSEALITQKHSDRDEESDSEWEGDDEDNDGLEQMFGGKPSKAFAQKFGDSLKMERMEADFRILADAVNEWLPCWEFKGSFLRLEDLIQWGVVEPSWVFGGMRSRGRGPRVKDSMPQKLALAMSEEPSHDEAAQVLAPSKPYKSEQHEGTAVESKPQTP